MGGFTLTDQDKFILDACCGGRQFWFDKTQGNTIFMDIRQVDKGTIEMRPNWCIEPDVVGDYRDMKFPDKSFKLVVWDIPHITAKKISGIIMQKYGYLDKDTWENDLKQGFNEIMRVLDDYGVLTFKYADVSIPIKTILSLFPIKPLFGTITKKGTNNTYWFTFMKIPQQSVNPPTLPAGNPTDGLTTVKRETDVSPNLADGQTSLNLLVIRKPPEQEEGD